MLQTLSKLNCVCASAYQDVTSAIPLAVLESAAGEVLYKRLVNFWTKGKLPLTRQQLLASMKFTLLWNTGERESQVRVEEDLSGFFRVLYRVTDFLQRPFEKELHACENEEAKDRVMLANLALMQEFCFSPAVPHLWLRYWLLYGDCINQVRQRFPSQDYRLHERFNELTGLDLKLFICLVMAIWFHCKNINLNDVSQIPIGPQFFAQLKDEVRERAKTIFSKVSSNQEELGELFKKYDREFRNKYYSFQPFWIKPLMKIRDDLYCPLDIEFLGQKGGQGVYFEINDALLALEESTSRQKTKELEKERNRLMSFMGRVVETYVYNLLKRVYGSGPLTTLSAQMDKDETGGVDFVIAYPGSVVFIEVTALAVQHNTLLTADWSEISNAIRGIFFGKKGRKSKGKIEQLDEAIKKFMAGKLTGLKCDPGNIQTIYPLLVMQKSLPCWIHHIECYEDWFEQEKLLGQHGKRFDIVDLEELELVEPLLKKGETLTSLLTDWNTQKVLYGTFHNFLLKSKNAGLSQNEYLTKESEKFTEETSRVLFGVKHSQAEL